MISYLKEHLPGPVASQLDSALSGEDSSSGSVAGAASKLGGIFGKK